MADDERPRSRRSDTPMTALELRNHLEKIIFVYGPDVPVVFGAAPLAGGVLIQQGPNSWKLSLACSAMGDLTGGF